MPLDVEPIRKNRIYAEVIDRIKRLIVDGQLKPGDKLPSERELASALGVSRSTVREAVSVLASSGLVEVKPGLGMFIGSSGQDHAISPLSLMLLVERDSSLELLELRKILEAEAAAMAAERAPSEVIEMLEHAYAEMEADLNSGGSGEDADVKFHELVAKATMNMVMTKVMNSLNGLFRYSINQYRKKTFMHSNRPHQLLADHRAILDAIRSHDPEKAREAMRSHFKSLEKSLQL
ncbi:MAG TPA: FadR family transcriptional regulator [Firmicutes bacterium]|nr:FadR family transcriptional regulator [Bacillota bacterium]